MIKGAKHMPVLIADENGTMIQSKVSMGVPRVGDNIAFETLYTVVQVIWDYTFHQVRVKVEEVK